MGWLRLTDPRHVDRACLVDQVQGFDGDLEALEREHGIADQ